MKISELLAGGRPCFSFEFFPPKTADGIETLLRTVGALRELEPGFVSVTYGAGGSTRLRTIELAKRIKQELAVEVLAHVTCVGSSRDDLRRIFDELRGSGIENVLALRGDPPLGDPGFTRAPDGFAYAGELIAMLKSEFDFCVGAAAYPETHVEAQSPQSDLEHLAEKVDAGAAFLITQLFFENAAYRSFVQTIRRRGIGVPIVPGIMPITNFEQIARFTAMCGATIPPRLLLELERRAAEPEAVADLGVAFAGLQCAELLAHGAPGIHFYTLNRSPATRAVVSALYAARTVAQPIPT
ncbi:MAG: methylenetetrahydrofolate reductase [NAD(P)H] [Vulcanimicrobiaceae bacterium]